MVKLSFLSIYIKSQEPIYGSAPLGCKDRGKVSDQRFVAFFPLFSKLIGAMFPVFYCNVFYMVCILLLQSPDSSQIILLSWQRGFDVLSERTRSHCKTRTPNGVLARPGAHQTGPSLFWLLAIVTRGYSTKFYMRRLRPGPPSPGSTPWLPFWPWEREAWFVDVYNGCFFRSVFVDRKKAAKHAINAIFRHSNQYSMIYLQTYPRQRRKNPTRRCLQD